MSPKKNISGKYIKMKSSIPFVDLFAGCGGLSLGLEQAGAEPCFMDEVVSTYAEAYINNHDLSLRAAL